MTTVYDGRISSVVIGMTETSTNAIGAFCSLTAPRWLATPDNDAWSAQVAANNERTYRGVSARMGLPIVR